MKVRGLFVPLSLVLVCVMLIGLMQFPLIAKGQGENWLSGWDYRKSVIVKSGLHVISVHYGSGSDVLGHTYLNGLCQTDFDDIRFTNSDGVTLIDSVTVRIRVIGDYAEFKVDVVESPIYVYYGNSEVSGFYENAVLTSGSIGDTDDLTQSYTPPSDGGQISGIARASPVTGFALSLEAVISSEDGGSAQMALLLMSTSYEQINYNQVYGRRIVALTDVKNIPSSDKHREVFTFNTPVPIFRGTVYGIALWASNEITVWYESGAGEGSFFLPGGFSGDMVLHTSSLGTQALGRFMNYEQVDEDEQNILFRDNADYTKSRSMWHHHYETNGEIGAEAGQGIGGSYAFNSTVTATSGIGYGELSVKNPFEDGDKRFWSGVVRLSTLPRLDSHIELMAVTHFEPFYGINGFGVDRTDDGVQWRLSARNINYQWSHTLFGEVEADTDYFVILSYELDGSDAITKVWITELDEQQLLEETSPTETLTVTNDVIGDCFFIGAANYPFEDVTATSAFFDEMTLTETFPKTFGTWGNEEIFTESPKFTSDGVVSGASYSTDPISPGSISSIFGEYLALEIDSAEVLPLPKTLGGTTVYLDDIECPLYYVSPEQINFQVPYELEGENVALMVIECDGISSIPVSIAIASVNPGIFTTNMQGTGAGCVLHNSDSSLVTSINPATRGEYLQIYCTGLGLVNPDVETGAAASSDPLCHTLVTPVVIIGGVEADVLYSGLAPGFVGLYQVNVQVPETAPLGEDVSLLISVVGIESNVVTLAIQ
ncbi:MAG: hypothetical protein JXA91_08315 [Candidatus Thermoplasmatota archaeon]|nr:hypothetical protein [Candidatus Thermoplasmatota archaeon]